MKRSGFKKKTLDEVIAQQAKKKRTTSRIKRSRGISKPKTKPVKTISKLKKELWKLFSLYIRTRDNFTCVTCGKKGEGGAIHAGHFITGATCGTELYFDEDNVHAQCYHCNINLSGNWVKYEEFMVNTIGYGKVETLKRRRTLEMGRKITSEWYEQKITEYKEKNKQALILLQEMW